MPTDFLAGVEEALRPPPRLSLLEWAERHFYLSAESSADVGRWRSYPYQRGILNAITSPRVERVTWMKSARVGATKCMNATIGYYMHKDPCTILVVQPTVEDAQGYSKEEIAPMLRDCSELARLVGQPTAKISEQTILHKSFPGGILRMVGANSGRGFRRISARVVLFDEVDAYPPSAGNDGDPIRLGIMRSQTFWNRKIVAASTPLIAGASRIEQMFEAGDQRRYHVPCPHCGHMDYLVFRESERGHWMAWPDDEPESAHFVCSKNGCVIEHHEKPGMLEAGEWVADAEFCGHASFHIWAAYSLSVNATWGQIAKEFLAAKREGASKLQTFVNTVLGETWHDRGEAPDWERLYQRRSDYPIGTVPDGVIVLTAGVDVQKDGFPYEVVGWTRDKQNFSVEAGFIPGDTAQESSWRGLDDLLNLRYPGAGKDFAITRLAIDSGYNTQMVYNWARRHPMSRVIACKGMSTARTLVGTASPVDVTVRGRRLQRGYKVWPIGVDIAKGELYGWLRLPVPLDGEEFPPGFCHFPEYDAEFFRQLTAEHLVKRTKRSGHVVFEWQVIPNRQNHYLDTRVLARAAVYVLGLDRGRLSPPSATRSSPTPRPQKKRPRDDWLGGRADDWLGGRGRDWLSKRR